MHKYISKQADGSIIEFEAIDYPNAIEQYYRKKCSGELYHSIDFERQPSVFREQKNKQMLTEYDQKKLWLTNESPPVCPHN